MAKYVVLTGGGIKSAAAAAKCRQDGPVELVHVDYGQASVRRELTAVAALAAWMAGAELATYSIAPGQIDFHEGGEPGGPASDGQRAVTQGGARLSDNPAGRVMLLLSIGVRHAVSVGATEVVTGLSFEANVDHIGLSCPEGQPDRRRQFLHAMSMAAESMPTNGPAVRVFAPLSDMPFADIVKLATHFEIPLDRTWTCGSGAERPCGACGPCKARAQAFVKAGIVDPALAAT